MAKVVIGLIAKSAAGKETFDTLLKEWAIEHGYMAHVVYTGTDGLLGAIGDDLNGTGFVKTAGNLIALSNVIRKHFGKETLANGAKRLVEQSEAQIVVYDAVRWDTDLCAVQSFKDHLTVFVSVNADTRYERLKARARPGEAVITWLEFVKREQDPTAIEIQRLGEMADCLIPNDLGLEEYREAVRNFLRLRVKPIVDRQYQQPFSE